MVAEPNGLGQHDRVLQLALAARVGVVHETQQLHVEHVGQLDQRKRPYSVLITDKTMNEYQETKYFGSVNDEYETRGTCECKQKFKKYERSSAYLFRAAIRA